MTFLTENKNTKKTHKRMSKKPKNKLSRKISSVRKRPKSKGKMKMVVPMRPTLEYNLPDQEGRKNALLSYLGTTPSNFPFNDGLNPCNILGLTDDEQAYEEIRYYKENDTRFKYINVRNFFENSLVKTNYINIINQQGVLGTNIPWYSLSNKLSFVLKIPTDTTSRNSMLNKDDPNKLIGGGTFGIIYQGGLKIIPQNNFNDIVIKEILRSPNLNEDDFKRSIIFETSIQSHLYCSYNKHLQSRKNSAKIPKIHFITAIHSRIELDQQGPSGPVRTFGNPNDPPRYIIGMEKMNMNLSNYIHSIRNFPMEEREESIRKIVQKLCNLIVFLQQNELFVHRDLHCGNVMIDGNDNCYLIDFGFSALISRNIDTRPSQYQQLDILSHDSTENKMHNVRLLNPSHDIRMLCANLLEQPDLPPKFQKMLAKRFCICAWSYLNIPEPPNQNPLVHKFYNNVYNNYDFRFDPNINNDMFEDFEQLPSYSPTPPPNFVLTYRVETPLQDRIKSILHNVW